MFVGGDNRMKGFLKRRDLLKIIKCVACLTNFTAP